MPITGTFEADFSQFSDATKAAQADLRAFQQESTKTATAMTGLEKSTTTAVPSVTKLSTEFRAVDKTLASVGINISREIGAIEEIGEAAKKGAEGLSTFTKVSLGVGAAMAGWNLGRRIAEWTGADEAIGNATAKLLGWGDVAAQVAGAQQDSINLAFQRTGIHARDAAHALQLNTQWAKEHNKEAKEAAKANTDWAEATAVLADVAGNWQQTLATISGDTVEAIKYYLDAGVAQKDLATAYGLTDLQIKAVEQSLRAEAEALKAATTASEEAAAAISAHWDDVGAILDEVFGVDQLQAATNWVDAIDTLGGSVAKLSNVQLAELRDAMYAGIDALARSGELTSSQSSRFAELALAAEQALEATKAHTVATEAGTDAAYEFAKAQDAEYFALLRTNEEKQKTVELEKAKADITGQRFTIPAGAHDPLLDNPFYRQHLAEAPGGMPYVEPAWVTQARENLRRSAQYGTTTQNVYITQPLGTKEEIARVVGDALSSTYGSRGNRIPA